MKQAKRLFLICLFTIAGMCGCDSIDCTLNNTVVMTCSFYQDGKAVQVNDTLSITGANPEIVLLNRKLGAKSAALPLSYFYPVDTLLLTVTGEEYKVTDTLWIEKTSYNHFESPDCPVNMFHNITAVRSTHLFIDSVSITRPEVDVVEYENLQIHFYSSAD